MKKSFTTEAINLKNYPLNDNDSIVVMFSKTKGLIRAIAKGTKRPKSKLGARIQMFIANKLMLFEGRNLDTISEAQSVNTFSNIRYDLDKLSYSMYIAELVNTFCSKQYNKDENASEIYDLIYGAYGLIAQAKDKNEAMLHLIKFLLKFMSALGWGLDFKYCSTCQGELNKDLDKSSLFSLETGGFICPNCAKDTNTSALRVHNKIIEFLNALSEAKMDEKTLYDEKVNTLVLEKCFLFLKKYIDNLTNKRTHVFEILDMTKAAV